MKICKKCQTTQPATNFEPHKQGRDGLHATCRTCRNAEKRRRYAAHRDEQIARMKRWRDANKNAIANYNKTYRAENVEFARKCASNYQHNNLPKYAADRAERRAAKQNATPVWVDRAAIKTLYERARQLTVSTGIVHHVDHIVPLRSALVCGLHWHGNLQVLPASENVSKGNRHWPDMPE